ncbi:hypothetical protein [Aureliella helgolandensis]|uniref:Uncharacterized protein n=1 Tax=Aureliella helgolandensis TaxID=2527968 RepID=A0A518GG07_9BACT|nr:hypothetical protein [Aureliella helgolandensis]QDV27510.1 hypothetical protein Q31a_58990 [Aureliella helgolandensis]
MPRTAAPRTTNRTNRNARAVPTPAQTSPVLFRFPYLERHLDEADTEDEQPAQTPQSASPIPLAAELAASPVAIAPAVLQPEPISNPSSPATAANSVAASAESSSSSASELDSKPLEPQSEAKPSLTVETERTWWEHWSSGLVLIVLVIALVTASLIAFNDSGSSSAETLATEEPADPFDLSLSNTSLSNISIPAAVANSTSELAIQAPAATSDNNATSPASTSSAITANEEATVVASESPAEQLAVQPQTELAPASPAAQPPEASGLIPETLEFAGPEPAAPSASSVPPAEATLSLPEPALLAGASLQAPVGETTPPLFPQSNSTAAPPSGAAVPSAPTFPAASSSASTPVEAPGASPSLYDGARSDSQMSATTMNTNLPQPQPTANTVAEPAPPASSFANTPPASEAPIQTTAKPYVAQTPATFASGTPTAVQMSMASSQTQLPGTEQQQAPSSAATGYMPNAANPATATPPPPAMTEASPVASATPDMDAQAIIRAYQEFVQMQRAQAGTENRYQTAAPR